MSQAASPTIAEIRVSLNEEIAYYRRCIPGTHTSRLSAERIVRVLAAHPVMHDQIPDDRTRMIYREAKGLPPVER